MPCITINFGIGQTEPTCENVLTCLLEVTHYDAINGIPKSHMRTVGYYYYCYLTVGKVNSITFGLPIALKAS